MNAAEDVLSTCAGFSQADKTALAAAIWHSNAVAMGTLHRRIKRVDHSGREYLFRPHFYINTKPFNYNNGLAVVAGKVHVVQPGDKRYIFHLALWHNFNCVSWFHNCSSTA